MTNQSVTIFVSASMGSPLPFVEAALICENLIIDKQDIPSIIRVIDKIEAEIPESIPGNMPPAFPVQLFLRLRSGSTPISGSITLTVKKPDGTTGGNLISPQVDLQAYKGYQFKVETNVVKPQQGHYFFNILWNSEPLTTVTLEVSLRKVPAVVASPPQIPPSVQQG